jgi:hypothetical protein
MSDAAAGEELTKLLEFAVGIAEAAAPIALRYFRAPLEVQPPRAFSLPPDPP